MTAADKSQAEFFRDAGFQSQQDFNLSYGVKPGDHEGHEESEPSASRAPSGADQTVKDLVGQMREHDQK
jgi:hypothetical protein